MTVHTYLDPERFVTGTVGPPGQRTFFLQAHDGTRTTSAALEKEQVRVLAERLDAMLDLLTRRAEQLRCRSPSSRSLRTATTPPSRRPSKRTSGSRCCGSPGTATPSASSSRRPLSPLRTTTSSVVRSWRCGSPARWRGRSSPAPSRSWPRVDRPARSAPCRWTPKDTSARGPTATAGDERSRSSELRTGELDGRRPAHGRLQRQPALPADRRRPTVRGHGDRRRPWSSTSRGPGNVRSGTSRTGTLSQREVAAFVVGRVAGVVDRPSDGLA